MSGGLWFTSDLHLGHRKVAEIRGFNNTMDHDLAVVARWNDNVRPDDTVWVLGDIAVSSPRYALDVIHSLHGQKHLIWGNHDAGHPMHRDAHKNAAAYFEVFASVASSARRRIDGTEVLLSHFPYTRDRDETRHAQWRLPDLGAWLIHGHTHGPERLTITEHADLTVTREIHVGLDAWGLEPVPLSTIALLMKENP